MSIAGMWRSWRRCLVLTAEFSGTIAVGMGSAAALVSLLLAVGYRPLPYRDSGQLVAVWERVEAGADVAAISGPDLVDFANATHDVFSGFGGFAVPQVWFTDHRGETKVRVCYIQASIFRDLGIRPVLGRGAQPDDERLSTSGIAPIWISYELWRSRYGGNPSVIGTMVAISGTAAGRDQVRMSIAGVLPPGVSIPLPFMENTSDVWYILPFDIAARPRQAGLFFGVARLRPGVSVAQAQAALTVVAERLGQHYTFDRRKRPVVQGLEQIAHEPAQRTMGLLVSGVGLVFLLGCVNLAILMGAEGRWRRREIAIRAALGASRWRLLKDVAAEKCALTLLSLGLGAVLASALLRGLARLVPTIGLGPPLVHAPPLNLTVLFCSATFSMAAAVIWSALLVHSARGPESSRTLAAAGDGLGYTGLSDVSPSAGRWRLVLLAAQTGTGICLVAASALTVSTYIKISAADLGPDPKHTVLMSVAPRDNIVLTDVQAADFNQELLLRLQRLPGMRAIALADLFPPPGFPTPFFKRSDTDAVERDATWPIWVSPGYFNTLGIAILRGRGFSDLDNNQAEPVTIISLDMAQRNWTSLDRAVGSQISFDPKSGKRYKIVGVAANFGGYWRQRPIPTVYLPVAQSGNWCGEVILRTAAPTSTIAELAPQLLSGMEIAPTISDVSTMQEHWQTTLTRPLVRVVGMLLLALVGLSLSVQGVYAVAAATVAARSHELAVRCALGANPARLAWNATREMVMAIIVGTGLGVTAGLDVGRLLGRWLGPLVYGQVTPLIVAVVLLGFAAAAGCYIPVRIATRSNPIDVLRHC